MERPSQLPRRTEGKRTHGRSARVLEAVLDAAALELGRVGFAALRIEDVAAQSGVNKTTIYRRWPTKLDLIAAVIDREKLAPRDFDTGTLESDVRAALLEMRARMYTVRQRGVFRVLLGEQAHPEVAQLVRSARDRHLLIRRRMFERAIERGELPAGADAALLVELMTAPLASRILNFGREVDDVFIEQLTRVLCSGAKSLA
jgi:AcrR family transcriptional regulator